MRLTDRKQANSHQGWGVGGIKGKKNQKKLMDTDNSVMIPGGKWRRVWGDKW